MGVLPIAVSIAVASVLNSPLIVVEPGVVLPNRVIGVK